MEVIISKTKTNVHYVITGVQHKFNKDMEFLQN